MKCRFCGGANIEFDHARSDSVCMDCGAVLEENAMVAELTFGEGSSGAAHVVGQFVSNTASSANLTYGSKFGGFQGRECRAITIERGNRRINHIANALRMSTSHQEAAQRIFSLAVQRNFTRGRKTNYIAAICLYIVARREKTSYLLIDFADALQTSVKSLSKAYTKLIRLLHIDAPVIDPSLFAERFINRLNLKEVPHSPDTNPSHNNVLLLTVKLIHMMNKNWISAGRRPLSICGACILIAARFYGYGLATSRIASLVRVSESTILKRLSEFRKTSVAFLSGDTVGEEGVEGLDKAPVTSVPPAFLRNQVKSYVSGGGMAGLERVMERTKQLLGEWDKEVEAEGEGEEREEDVEREERVKNAFSVEYGSEEEKEGGKREREEEMTEIDEDEVEEGSAEIISNIKKGFSKEKKLGFTKAHLPYLLASSQSYVNTYTTRTMEEEVKEGLHDEDLQKLILTREEACAKETCWLSIMKNDFDYLDVLEVEREKREKRNRPTISIPDTKDPVIKKDIDLVNVPIFNDLYQDIKRDPHDDILESVKKGISSSSYQSSLDVSNLGALFEI